MRAKGALAQQCGSLAVDFAPKAFGRRTWMRARRRVNARSDRWSVSAAMASWRPWRWSPVVPLRLLEQNRWCRGRFNSLLARLVLIVCAGFRDTATQLRPSRGLHRVNPGSSDLFRLAGGRRRAEGSADQIARAGASIASNQLLVIRSRAVPPTKIAHDHPSIVVLAERCHRTALRGAKADAGLHQ